MTSVNKTKLKIVKKKKKPSRFIMDKNDFDTWFDYEIRKKDGKRFR